MHPDSYVQQVLTPEGRWDLVKTAIDMQLNRMNERDLRLHIPPVRQPFQGVPVPHFHAMYEWVFQMCGVSIWRLAKGRMSVAQGEMLLIPRGVAHWESRLAKKGRSCNVNVSVYSKWVGVHFHLWPCPANVEYRRLPRNLRIPVREPDFAFGLLTKVVEADVAGLGKENPYVEGLMLAALGALHEGMRRRAEKQPQVYSSLVTSCIHRVQQHLSNWELTVPSIAAKIGCSPDYLSHLFGKETGQTLVSFITEERIKLGKQLLQDTTMNITEVARGCGFGDPNYFARLFKRSTGQAPLAFRKTFLPAK